MKPRKQRLIIERTAHSDSTLGQGIPDEWIVKTERPCDMRMHARDEDQVLLLVKTYVRGQLEREARDAQETTQDGSSAS
jgi:hypothetical protein